MAWWPSGLGNLHWPQLWDLPKIPPCGQQRIESCTHRNIHRLPCGNSTCRLNFYKLLCGLVAQWFRQLTLASTLGPPQNPTMYQASSKVIEITFCITCIYSVCACHLRTILPYHHNLPCARKHTKHLVGKLAGQTCITKHDWADGMLWVSLWTDGS